MTQEERDIIYKDACGRILYKPYAAYEFEGELIQVQITGMEGDEPTSPFYGYSFDTWGHIPHDNVKLYLRSMSSIHKDPGYIWYCNTLTIIRCCSMNVEEEKVIKYLQELQTWLISRHYDINHLIERNLAFEAPEGMYN